MKANPGGQLRPEDVIGRDEVIRNLTRILERQSVVLSAERRTGKTQTIKKLQADGHANWLILYRDLEAIASPADFAKTILADAIPHLGSGKQFKTWFDGLLDTLGGTQIGPIKLPNIPANDWKQVLTDTLAHVSEHQGEKRIVFLWDELPMMLQKIGDQAAMEVLDVLRHVRQTHGNIRMIFTGSIGLHHVIHSLKDKGYVNAAINDMHRQELSPLQPPYGATLARELMRGEGLSWDKDETCTYLAERVDGIPFYIHHVVDRLHLGAHDPVTPGAIDAVVVEAMADEVDAWELKHYVDRVPTYYGKEATRPILALLDDLMASDRPLAISEIVNRVSAQCLDIDTEQWRLWLDDLTRDHYLIRDKTSGAYRYRFSLIRQWWRWSRGV